MAHLVMGDAVAFFRHETQLSFQPRDDAWMADVKSSSVTASPLRRVATMAASLTRFEIGAGEIGRQPGNLVEIDAVREPHLGDMNLDKFQPPSAIRPVDQHLAVEATGPQQGRIERLRAIGRAGPDLADARIEAVEFGEQLIDVCSFSSWPP